MNPNPFVQHLIQFRRELHRQPELSGMEEHTADRIVEELSGLNLRIRMGVAGHGIIADLEGAHSGPLLAYRADMDALPIREANEVPYRSCRRGVMHACGHDVHIAVGVGIAHALASQAEDLHGRVRFIFQPAEEAPPRPGEVIGAEAMVVEGVLENVQAIFSIHCIATLDVGLLGYGVGGVFAASDVFTIRIDGQSAHGADPHRGVDAIHMAATVIQALLALPARFIDARQSCVLSIGTIQAGTAHNIIAGKAILTGSLRTFDSEVRKTAHRVMRQIVNQIPKAYGGRGRIEIQQSTQAVINHPELERRAIDALKASAGAETVVPQPAQMGSEDFAEFGRRVPGCYLYLGIRNESRGIIHPAHTPQFDVDEACIPFAVEHLSAMIRNLARQWTPLG